MTHISLRRALALSALHLICTNVSADDLGREATFNIGAQSVEAALLEFSRQADVQVMAPTEAFDGRSTTGVKGRMSLGEALQVLLRDTGLQYETKGDTVLIRSTFTTAAAGTRPIAAVMTLTGAAAYSTSSQPAETETTKHDAEPLDDVRGVMSAADVVQLQRSVASVSVDDAIVDYLMRIVSATRDSEMLDLGVSPRATLALFRAAQALALTEQRSFCVPDDIKRLVLPVFAHRLVISSRYASSLRRSEEAEAVLREIMKAVSVPL